jgi:hypothetical protein
MVDNPSSSRQPEEEVKVDGERFDALLREVTSPTSRRRIVGGVLGGVAALVAGTAVIKAVPGKGKGKGQNKVQICHFQGTKNGVPKYKVLKLGAPGAENHLANHEEDTPFVDCCPGDVCEAAECFTASCVEGTCTSTPEAVNTPCVTDTGAPGVCDGAGICNPV